MPNLKRDEARSVITALDKIDGARVTWDEVRRNERRFAQYQLAKGFNPIAWVMTRGDDIVLWADEGRIVERARLHSLRQQMDKGEVKKDEEGLKNMADLGQTIAWLGKAIQQSPDRISSPVYSEPSP